MFHIKKDERLVSKIEGKTIFFEAPETVRWLDLTDRDLHILRQFYVTAFRNRSKSISRHASMLCVRGT